MLRAGAHLTVTLDLKDPVELGDFARLFAAIGDQFEAHIQNRHPDMEGEVKFYLVEIRDGSIIADIVPMVRDLIGIANESLIVAGFAKRMRALVNSYTKGEQAPNATKKDLANIVDLCRSVAHDGDGEARIESVRWEDDGETRRLEVSFNTYEARNAIATAESQKADLDKTEAADHRRVLMVFERSSTRGAAVGKRSGERVVIEDIDDNARPLIYASDMAERQIRHEIRETDDNVFKKGFVVDVNVTSRDRRPVAYSVTHLHQIIDLPDAD